MSAQLKNRFSTIRWEAPALLLILLLGGYLRLHELGEESLWNDELESWRQSSFGSARQVIAEGVLPDTHPPGFQLILYAVENSIGVGEAQLRLPSAISGILSILGIFLLGKRYFSGRVAVWASLFMAVLWAPVSYSQEARNYALVMLLGSIAGYFWMDLVTQVRSDHPLRWGGLVGYVASAAACAYTHYFGLLLIVLQSMFFLSMAIVKRRYLPALLATCSAVGLLYAPWIPSMIQQTSHTERISWIQPPAVTAFPAFISFAYNRLTWLGAVVIALYGWLLWQRIRSVRAFDRSAAASLLTSPDGLLVYWLGAPMVIAFLVSVLWTPIFTQRNLLICLPAVYLLLASAIDRLPIRPLGQGLVAIAIAGVGLYTLVYSMGYYRFDQKEQFREAVGYVVEQYPESGAPPIIAHSRFPEYFDYYFERFGSDLRVGLSAGENEDVGRLRSYLDAHDPERIWFLSAHEAPDDGFLQALQERYVVLDQRSFVMAGVWLFAKPGS